MHAITAFAQSVKMQEEKKEWEERDETTNGKEVSADRGRSFEGTALKALSKG